MAKITVAGQAVVITSAMKLEDILTIKKYRPDSLTLYSEDEEKEPIFKIGIAKDGAGTIGTYGVEFAHESNDKDKLAGLTLLFEGNGDADDLKEFIMDSVGGAVLKLNKLEKTLPGVLAEIEAEKREIAEHISIVQ